MTEEVQGEMDPQTVELAFAEMENRLREMITGLMQPTISRQTLAGQEIENLVGMVNQHSLQINEVMLQGSKIKEVALTLDKFREEMFKNFTQSKGLESAISEKVALMQVDIDRFSKTLEQKESALHHFQRSLDVASAEFERCREQQQEGEAYMEKRMDDLSKEVNRINSMAEVKVASMGLQITTITDRLWGEETGLAKVSGQVCKVNDAVGRLRELVDTLKSGKAEKEETDELRQTMEHKHKSTFDEIRRLTLQVGSNIDSTKEHVRTAIETCQSSNQAFVNEVRTGYQTEIQTSTELRSWCQEVMEQTRQSIEAMEKKAAAKFGRSEGLISECRQGLEGLDGKRQQDKSHADLELKGIKTRLGAFFENSDAAVTGLERVSAIVNMVLEITSMKLSMDEQDDVDRRTLTLMGVNEAPSPDDGTKMSPKPSPKLRRPGRAGAPPVIEVDKRCLSCSGQAPTVLQAFKMACLSYNPSPVAYRDAAYDRGTLLDQQQRLLAKAQGLLAGALAADAESQGPASPTSSQMLGGGVDYAQSGLGEYHISSTFTKRSPRKSDSLKLPALGQASPRGFSGRLG